MCYAVRSRPRRDTYKIVNLQVVNIVDKPMHSRAITRHFLCVVVFLFSSDIYIELWRSDDDIALVHYEVYTVCLVGNC